MTSDPKLWDVKPIAVTHIAGAVTFMFGRYMRQRCDWCGIILLDYDLERVAVPVGQSSIPGHWAPGKLIRVDGNVSAEVEGREVEEGQIQLPPDACAFDPETQYRLRRH